MLQNNYHKKILIISPSGKFYGSERVLYDFLSETKKRFHVWAPEGLFYEKLQKLPNIDVQKFTSIKKVYFILFFKLLVNIYDTIYINEGGHIRYVKLLAKIFSSKRFVVHLRLLEDTTKDRLVELPENVTLVTVSQFISAEVKHISNKVIQIYDPFSGLEKAKNPKVLSDSFPIKIGVIGRITPTKGLIYILSFLTWLNQKQITILEFHFFGQLESNNKEVAQFLNELSTLSFVKAHLAGYLSSTSEIYNNIDAVIHFNKTEALGRVVFESVWFGKPFYGFLNGGIGELCTLLGIEQNLLEDTDGWEEVLFNKILIDRGNSVSKRIIIDAQNRLLTDFNVTNYSVLLESVLENQ